MDLPQAATNRNRTRGAGGSGGPKGGKSGMGQKMGESKQNSFFLKTLNLLLTDFVDIRVITCYFQVFHFLLFWSMDF